MPFFISKKKLEAEIAKRAAEACDHIIKQMGAELHDDLIQKLDPYRLYMDRVDRAYKDPEEVRTLATQMKSKFEEVDKTIRNISHRLMPDRMKGDTLIDILKNLFKNMEEPGLGHIHFANEGDPRPVGGDVVEIYILRIVQELIHNAFKHSSAWHVYIRLKWAPGELLIDVEDNGTEFQNIHELIRELKKKYNTVKMRTQAIGASIDYLPGEKGLLVKIRLPTNQRSQAPSPEASASRPVTIFDIAKRIIQQFSRFRIFFKFR